MPVSVAAAVSKYGASLKPKFSGAAITGAPEDQLRNPLETLIKDLGEVLGRPAASIHLVGETTLIELNSRPDFAVTVGNALVGFIEVKAPKKGANPRNFTDRTTRPNGGGSRLCRTFSIPTVTASASGRTASNRVASSISKGM